MFWGGNGDVRCHNFPVSINKIQFYCSFSFCFESLEPKKPFLKSSNHERPQTYDSPFRCSAILLPIPSCQGNHDSQNQHSGTSVHVYRLKTTCEALGRNDSQFRTSNLYTHLLVICLPLFHFCFVLFHLGSISIQFQQTMAF